MSVDCPIYGDLSYLFLADEATYGVQDASPDYTYLPVFNYDVENVQEMRQPQPFTGFAEDYDNLVVRQAPAGPMACALYGWRTGSASISLAEYVMAWAFTDLETLCGLPSKTAQWAEGPNVCNKKHLGMMVNNATLAGADDNGGQITLSLDIVGASESTLTTAQTIPSDLTRLNEFMFTDSTFSIGPNSGALVSVEYKGFSWQQQRNLIPIYNGARSPRRYRPQKPTANFSFNIEKADGTWDAIRRATDATNYYGRLVLKGAHNGTGATGNYAQVQIDFPKLSFRTTKDTRARNGVVQQQISFGLLKPTTSAASSTQTWSEV